MEKKYYSVKEAAEFFGRKPAFIRQICHAKDQRFAVQPVKGGNLMIDVKKCEEHLKKYWA